jgi:hypothetical protein
MGPMRACQGHRTAKASDIVPETPPTKGCQAWRWIGAIRPVVSFLASLGFPFALRGYTNEGTAHGALHLSYRQSLLRRSIGE